MATFTYTLLSHQFQQDYVVPGYGEIIKVPLPEALIGQSTTQSTSFQSSLSAGSQIEPTSTRRRRPRYHSAVVYEIFTDYDAEIISLKVWVVPTYSTAGSQFTYSVAYVNSLAVDNREKRIPMPCIPLEGIPIATTPRGFGQPLLAGGFSDRCPSWVLLEPQEVDLMPRSTWKSYNPAVTLPPDEVRRLKAYSRLVAASIPAAGANYPNMPDDTPGPDHGHKYTGSFENINPPGDNTNPPGAGSLGGGISPPVDNTGSIGQNHQLSASPAVISSLLRKGFGSHPKIVVPESVSEDSNDTDSSMDPISYARVFAPYSPSCAKILEDHEHLELQKNSEAVENLLAGLIQP